MKVAVIEGKFEGKTSSVDCNIRKIDSLKSYVLGSSLFLHMSWERWVLNYNG